MPHKNISLSQSLKQLEEIAEWFESREEIDVEAGLAKARAAAALIKETRKQLAAAENEFEEIQRDLIEEGGEK